jgi:hypothetical protein
VTRSINPENPSCGGDGGGVFTLQSVNIQLAWGQDGVTAGREISGYFALRSPRVARLKSGKPVIAGLVILLVGEDVYLEAGSD